MNTSDHELRIEFTPTDNKGTGTITASCAGEIKDTDTINIISSKARARYLNRMCEDFAGIDRDELLAQLNRLAAASAKGVQEAAHQDDRAASASELLALRDSECDAALEAMDADIRRDAADMLLDPNLIDVVLQDIEAIGVVGERSLAMTTYLLGTSRLLAKPFSAIIQGLSSTGKSYVPSRVVRLFPPESVLVATDITTNALYYLDPGKLMHTFVVAGERRRGQGDEHAETTRALREMIESGELRKVVTIKVRGDLRTVCLWQPGPIAYIESTTHTKIFDEDANRCLLLGTDESREQTERIVMAQARAALGASSSPDEVIARHVALQRILRRTRVNVAFAPAIARAIPKDRQEARRAMPHILTTIRTVSLLYQRQRAAEPLVHGSVINATLQDYVVARKLLTDPMGRALGGSLPDAVARFGHRISDTYGGEQFTSTQALKDDPILNSKGKLNEYLQTLEGAGVVACIEPARGPRPATWRVDGPVPAGGSLWLPTLAELEACV